MERTVWTDERLDDLALAMREGFARVDRDLAEMRTEIRDLRTLMFRLWGTNMRKAPIDLNLSTRSGGMRRPASISAHVETMSGASF